MVRLVSLTLMLGMPTLLWTQCKEDNGKVKVTVIVILASEDGTSVDQRLTAIAKEVQKQNPNLTKFVIHSQHRESLAEKERKVFEILEKQNVQVVVHHKVDPKNRVVIAVKAPDQGEIVYGTSCGKFLPIVTRYQTKANQRLILAVRVEPCKD